MNTLTQGLVISALGLTLTFAALALFILAIVVLERLFPVRAVVPEVVREEQPIAAAGGESRQDAAIAAAIAAALVYARQEDRERRGLGAALEAGHGRWWQPGYVPPVDGRSRGTQRRVGGRA